MIAALLGVGAVTSFLFRAADPSSSVVRGSLVLIVGIAITLVAVAIGSIVGVYAGSVIAGLGFGPAFSGAFRSLAPLAPPDRRGALLASIYIVVYLAFSVPSIVAGFAVPLFGLRDTTLAYGLVAMALAATSTLACRGCERLVILIGQDTPITWDAVCGTSMSHLVRESLRRTVAEDAQVDPERRIAAVLRFSRFTGPSTDIDQILAEIERGRGPS